MYNANTAERQRERQKGLPRQIFELDEVAEERSSQGDSVSPSSLVRFRVLEQQFLWAMMHESTNVVWTGVPHLATCWWTFPGRGGAICLTTEQTGLAVISAECCRFPPLSPPPPPR